MREEDVGTMVCTDCNSVPVSVNHAVPWPYLGVGVETTIPETLQGSLVPWKAGRGAIVGRIGSVRLLSLVSFLNTLLMNRTNRYLLCNLERQRLVQASKPRFFGHEGG